MCCVVLGAKKGSEKLWERAVLSGETIAEWSQ